MYSNVHYDRRALMKSIAWLVVFALACKFTKSFAFLMLLPVTLMYLVQGKSVSLFHVMMVSVFSLEINGYFIPKTFVMMVGQKCLLLMIASFLMLQVFGRRHSSIVTPTLWLFPYLIFMAISSQFGWAPAISNLKLLLFVMVFMALYGCSVKAMEDRFDARQLRVMTLTMACFIIFGSVLLIPFPGISIMHADEMLSHPEFVSLFKGMSWHSQTLGPMIAMFGTLVYADMAFTIQKGDRLYILLIICCPILVYKTSSRTAMASLLAGLFFVSFFVMQSRMVNKSWRTKVVSKVIMVTLIFSASVLAIPSVRDKTLQFVLKYTNVNDAAVTSDVIWKSRQHKLNGAIANWRASPYVGNGFQVSEEMKYIQINGIKDMLSAPIEKSTWTYAILEEGGVIGLFLFILFVIVSLCMLISRHAYIGASQLFVFLVVNFGEFGFFSMSASGGTCWCLVFVGLALDHKRLRGGWRMPSMMPVPFSAPHLAYR